MLRAKDKLMICQDSDIPGMIECVFGYCLTKINNECKINKD